MASLGHDLTTKIWLAKQKLSEGERKHLNPNLPAQKQIELSENDLEIAAALGQGDPTAGISLALRKCIQFEEVMFEI